MLSLRVGAHLDNCRFIIPLVVPGVKSMRAPFCGRGAYYKPTRETKEKNPFEGDINGRLMNKSGRVRLTYIGLH